jgi:hypothetical protein
MDVMIDLETMSSKKNAAVASLGAVVFDPDGEDTVSKIIEEKRSFYTPLNMMRQGNRHFEASTIYWWLEQSEEARLAVRTGEAPAFNPVGQFVRFNTFLDTWSIKRAWCHGATFDHVILESLYTDCGVIYPIHYANQFCSRTVCKLSKIPKPELPELVGHNALDDAIRQVIWLQQSLKYLKNGVSK